MCDSEIYKAMYIQNNWKITKVKRTYVIFGQRRNHATKEIRITTIN